MTATLTATTPMDRVLDRLDGARRAGEGWSARCPAHDDRTPSLSICEGEDGRVLIHCHAGCETQDVLVKLGLGKSDLFPPASNGHARRIVETYGYVDEIGELLFEVVRFEPKDFRQRRPTGTGWTWKLGDVRRVLYRIPEVIEAISAGRIIYVVEGEKDVHALERAGQIATCNPGGAGKWRTDYSDTLRGADVVIVADRDEPGRRHAASVVCSLDGTAASVRAVEPVIGKDIADHLGAGKTLAELVDVDLGEEEHEQNTGAVDRLAGSLIDWEKFWSSEHTDDDWLLEPIIARGRGHAGYAPAKGQKSLLTLYLVACLATGRAVLHQASGEPVHVLYLDLEMTQDDLRDRLSEMGFGPDTDLSHLHYHSLPSLAPLDTPIGGAEVVELAQHYGAEVVIVDTVSRVISGAENDADTMRNFYAYTGRPLKAAGIASFRLDHSGKDPAKGQRGTSAKSDDVDVVWQIVARDQGRLDLKATHRRMGWIPGALHLQLKVDPLRYELVDDTWPAGTAEAARLLDDLDVPAGSSRRTARQMVIDAGRTAPRNDVLGAALRHRRTVVGGLR